MLRLLRPILAALAALSPAITAAHDVPTANMTIVADEEMVHVELTVHTNQLRCYAEIDEDNNGLVDAQELNRVGERVAQLMIDSFTLRFGGDAMDADSYGIVPNLTTNHVTLRAHYPVDVGPLPIELEPNVAAVTRTTQVLDVAFKKGDLVERARVTARDDAVAFNRSSTLPSKSSAASATAINRDARAGWERLLLLAGLAVFVGSLFFFSVRKN